MRPTDLPRLACCCMALVLGCCGIAPSLTAQPEAHLQDFETGNRHYEAGDWQAAVTAYEQALQQGYTSGTLHYNLGNAYFRMDRLGPALLHYEKARRLMPTRREVLHNLDIARSRLPDQFPYLPLPWWARAWHSLVQFLGVGGLFSLGLLAYGTAAGLLAVRIRTRTRNPWHRRTLAVSALLGIVLLGATLAASTGTGLPHTAVLLAVETPLRETPDETAPTHLTIHEGLRLDLLRTTPGWLQVRLPNGVTGWVKAETVGMI